MKKTFILPYLLSNIIFMHACTKNKKNNDTVPKLIATQDSLLNQSPTITPTITPTIIPIDYSNDNLDKTLVKIILDNKRVCTGIVAGNRTVITTSHCLFSETFNSAKEKLSEINSLNLDKATSIEQKINYDIIVNNKEYKTDYLKTYYSWLNNDVQIGADFALLHTTQNIENYDKINYKIISLKDALSLMEENPEDIQGQLRSYKTTLNTKENILRKTTFIMEDKLFQSITPISLPFKNKDDWEFQNFSSVSHYKMIKNQFDNINMYDYQICLSSRGGGFFIKNKSKNEWYLLGLISRPHDYKNTSDCDGKNNPMYFGIIYQTISPFIKDIEDFDKK